MKRYEPVADDPVYHSAMMSEEPEGDYIRAEDALSLVVGCKDYSGGYDGEGYVAFQMGVQTVINTMRLSLKPVDDFQSAAVERIGAGELSGEKLAETVRGCIEELRTEAKIHAGVNDAAAAFCSAWAKKLEAAVR